MDQTPPSASPDVAPESLEDLFQRLRPRLKKILSRYRIPPQDAEDILQEAFTVALQKWDTVYNQEHWLLGTVRYRCILYWKRRRDLREEPMDAADLESLCQPQPPSQERVELVQEVENIARLLRREHRRALWLRYGVGLSTSEVARALGYYPATMRKLLRRCLQRLQKHLGEAPSPPPRP